MMFSERFMCYLMTLKRRSLSTDFKKPVGNSNWYKKKLIRTKLWTTFFIAKITMKLVIMVENILFLRMWPNLIFWLIINAEQILTIARYKPFIQYFKHLLFNLSLIRKNWSHTNKRKDSTCYPATFSDFAHVLDRPSLLWSNFYIKKEQKKASQGLRMVPCYSEMPQKCSCLNYKY